MNTNTITRRCLEVLALSMIGEGFVGLLRPRRYSRFWKLGPRPIRELMETLAEHRDVTRLICVGEVALGLWLAFHELDEAEGE